MMTNEEFEPRGGLYDQIYTLEEYLQMLAGSSEEELTDEIGLARIAMSRLAKRMGRLDAAGQEEWVHGEGKMAEYGLIVELLFKGADTIARLVREQRRLKRDGDGGVESAIAEALDELGEEWGIEL